MKVEFNGTDIRDMVHTVTIGAPWLHFPWGEWEYIREDVPAAFRSKVDPHEGHNLIYKHGTQGYDFRCRTCEKQQQATAAEQKLADTIRNARAALEGTTS